MITIMNNDYDSGRIVVRVVMMVYCNTTNFLLIFLVMLLVLARKKMNEMACWNFTGGES